jgi:hypothetical protein
MLFGIQNRWFERVHARTTKPLPYTSVKGKENKSIETGNRDDAFVFWRGNGNALTSCGLLPSTSPITAKGLE